VDFDIDKLEMNDDKVFSLIRSMKLEGLFQISGDAFVGRDFPLFDKETGEARIDTKTGKQRIFHSKGVMEIIGCDSFADIVAPLSLGRPGPLSLNMPSLYADGKINKDHLEYPHPKLEPILKETYSQMIYQEQLISMAMVLAGFNFSEADKLRKACGKKKPELLIPIEPKFREGCEKRNVPNNVIDNMWEIAVEFGAYAFNKSLYFSQGVMTENGEYTIEELFFMKNNGKVLPCVFSSNGKKIKIVDVFDHGDLPVYSVEFNDGSIVKCSMNHKFKTNSGVLPLYKIISSKLFVVKNIVEKYKNVQIKNISFDSFAKCYDLEVDSDDHLYLLSNGIVTSNSHSVAYGAITYQTAFLKTYYPTEFMCSLLTSAANTSDDKLNDVSRKLKSEYRNFNINKPDINSSFKTYFPINDFEVVAPLFSLKGVGKKVSDVVVEAREKISITGKNFVSVDQFFRTVNSGEKTMVAAGLAETLLEAGVFRSLGNKPKIKKEIERYFIIKKMISKKKQVTDKRLLEKVEDIF